MNTLFTSEYLESALAYARRGWPVFPCRDEDMESGKAKSPYTKQGFIDASTNPEQIRLGGNDGRGR